jgi:hypothetical protein
MNNHAFVNSDKTKFDSNCSVCAGKQRDCVHAVAQAPEIIVSGEPGVSEIIHHSQHGQQYVRKSDRTLWRVTRISGDVVQIHAVNGWEQLYHDTVPLADFWNRMALYV